jgi:hypothetical protein
MSRLDAPLMPEWAQRRAGLWNRSCITRRLGKKSTANMGQLVAAFSELATPISVIAHDLPR